MILRGFYLDDPNASAMDGDTYLPASEKDCAWVIDRNNHEGRNNTGRRLTQNIVMESDQPR